MDTNFKLAVRAAKEKKIPLQTGGFDIMEKFVEKGRKNKKPTASKLAPMEQFIKKDLPKKLKELSKKAPVKILKKKKVK